MSGAARSQADPVPPEAVMENAGKERRPRWWMSGVRYLLKRLLGAAKDDGKGSAEGLGPQSKSDVQTA